MIRVYYNSEDNFGDKLNNWLIKKITGQEAVWVSPSEEDPFYMCIGSILNHDAPAAIVWGAGCAQFDDEIPAKKIITTRGFLTAEMTHNFCGITPEYVGDPGLLIKNYYDRPVPMSHEVGIIPHFVEYATALKNFPGYKIIDVRLPVEKFIDEVRSCKRIFSSTLHGLICADVYGIPSRWALFDSKIGGDGFKFHDYFTTLENVDYHYPLLMFYPYQVERKFHWMNERIKIGIDLTKLLSLCPFS